jgi:hypothetical protein
MPRNRKSNSTKFFQEHPLCCLCGGTVNATTIEHAPPIALFVDRQLPSNTHTFPACERCNNGSRHFDQIATLTALVQASMITQEKDDYFLKVFEGVANNHPSVIPFFQTSDATMQEMSVKGTPQNMAIVPIDPLLFEFWLEPWAAKQAYALFYRHMGQILQPSARLVVSWITNAGIKDGRMPAEFLFSLKNTDLLHQGKKNSELQYEYRWGFQDDCGCFSLILHDASIAIVAIYLNPLDAEKHMHLQVFATNAEKGIHRVNPPWFRIDAQLTHIPPNTT